MIIVRIIFWAILFGIMSVMFHQVKESWKNKKFFNMIVWIFAMIIVFSIFAVIRELLRKFVY